MSKSKKSVSSKIFLPWKYIVVFCILLFILLIYSIAKTTSLDNVQKEETKSPIENKEKISIDISPAALPVKSLNVIDPILTAKGAMAIDLPSGMTLYAKDENLPLWPASTTKLMTALVALDQFSLDTILTVGTPIKDGRIMDLQGGEKITLESLLYGLLVHSANDAAFVIADNYPGGSEAFMTAMNKKASDLNLDNTHFVNPAGFDDNKQYSTAKDLARLSIFAMKNKTIAKIVSTPAITVHDVDFKFFHPLTTVNKLLGIIPGVAGVKTGWTENAKENLINLTIRDGKQILTVVLGSDDRFGETQTLTNWVYNNFTWQNINPSR